MTSSFDALNCTGEDTDGPDAFYKVNVAAGEILQARVESFGDEPPLVYAITDCADAANTCLAGGSEVGNVANRAELQWVNDTGAAQEVLVVADNEFSTADEPFGLFIQKKVPVCDPVNDPNFCDNDTLLSCNSVGLYDLYTCDGGCGNTTVGECDNPTGDACLDSKRLDATGGQLLDQSFSDTNTYTLPEGRTDGCFIDSSDENDEGDTFYKIDLQAGDVLQVDMFTNDPDAYLFLLEECGGICLKNTPQQGSSSISYYAAQAGTYYVVVDTDLSPGDDDFYDLEWSVNSGPDLRPRPGPLHRPEHPGHLLEGWAHRDDHGVPDGL